MSGVTRLLDAAAAGDRQGAADLLSLVSNELRNFAAARNERPLGQQPLDVTQELDLLLWRRDGPCHR
jgi:hypothetical protein